MSMRDRYGNDPRPCPVCAEPGGFHGEAAHAVARDQIPPELIRRRREPGTYDPETGVYRP